MYQNTAGRRANTLRIHTKTSQNVDISRVFGMKKGFLAIG
ncbi:hypothetical protein CYJ58_02695 [Gardnerella vaginalis]|uniref:Uncharacterized protein n=1 Tax=Gardnerella vaginalis (strain ATCC 14019 / 317) TaxID=525284 RepID=E3D722_GARV3|nr:hypothetical protein HMPREF0421_21110 [Gardnerella vaginalis ATCC 14019]PKY96980.1 hypothetical protein CYJ58_02695 [Gardnerella vaginalis]TCH79836.1 hypothetical protein E0E48_06790 [Gardnerella vaginalis]TCH81618.1 hypothetical protein E0E46_06340 [Gardnerella vaginalis ATCC 14018 = JCM 11026]